jgi:ABC-type Mn2+/Zn2+ transport system permease subunit
MAALRIAKNIQRALWLAAILGAISGFTGYLFAFLFELPVGASQAFVALACIPLAELAHRARLVFTRPT